MTSPIRILIVDDHPIVRRGIIQLLALERDLVVVGEVSTAAELPAALERLSPNVVLLDLTLPDGDGLALLKELAPPRPRTAFLVVTMHDQRVYADRCLNAGARGFLMKDCAADELVTAIRTVASGRSWEPRSTAIADPARQRLSAGVATLSDRQLEVFRCIGSGLSTRAIAESMTISIKTVEAHKEAIKERLGASGAADLLRLAMLWRDSEA